MGRAARVRAALGVALLGAPTACASAPLDATPPQAPPADQGPDAAIEPELASNRSEGEVVELTLVRADGSSQPLSSLRGRSLLLVVDAPWSEAWDELLAALPALAAEMDGALRVELVVVTDDVQVVDAVEGAGFNAAWDPQGAVAAQLSAATFPTLILLDAEGRMRFQAKGADLAGLRAALGL